MTAGYKDVEGEVSRQLTALTDRKEMKGVKSFDLIVWHRDVPGNNRKVDSDEHDACLDGALAALGKLKNKNLSKDTCVLHLGDKDKSPDKPPKKYLCSMLDQHVKGEKGGRTMLQQLQFICAVVDLSKAQLIVSERTGLADLLALAGGIPECQFVGRHEREGNDRLTEVYDSGCGMGMSVKFGKGIGNENEILMMEACTQAIADRKKLVIEMETIMKQT